MPCYDPDYSRMSIVEEASRRERELRSENAMLEAMLCGILTAFGRTLFDEVNWKEVGVPRDVAERWWIKHQEQDRKRLKKKG